MQLPSVSAPGDQPTRNAGARFSLNMASARESPKEMMSQLKALKGLTTGSLIVPRNVDLSDAMATHTRAAY